jgi:predicted phosphodiesterase
MTILIFSDLHGNSFVLDQLGKAIEKIKPEKIYFLGDVFGYFYDYRLIINFLHEHDVICLMGNHELIAKQILESKTPTNIKEIIDKYGTGYNKLFNDKSFYLNYINQLEYKATLEMAGSKLSFLHGSPSDPLNGRIYPDSIIQTSKNEDSKFYFLGHTHHRSVIVSNNNIYVNVGSAGQPRDGLAPCFVVFNTLNFSIRFFDLPKRTKNLIAQMNLFADTDKEYYKTLTRKPLS